MTNDLRTPDPADDGFHEIQLNGKQLVFLGMATTIVSVVIFLCGVLVGRGVRPVEPVAEAAAVRMAEPEAVVAEALPPSQPPAAAPAPATAAEEPAPVAESETPTEDSAAATPEPPAPPAARKEAPASDAPVRKPAESPAPAPRSKPAPAPAPEEAAPAPAARPSSTSAAPSATSAGGKIAVQVAALSNRGDAEAVARRLSSKGYAVYVVAPEPGAKAIFKVRVGNYASFDEAQRISSRLAEEEKLKPWIIR